ncbi:MAG: PKD domain-containing protein [Pseudomonadota bacterium]
MRNRNFGNPAAGLRAGNFWFDIAKPAVIASVCSLLWACGSSGGDGGTSNRAPIANGGADIAVAVAQVVTLDGSASSDPDGDSLSYAWSLIETPMGSSAVLDNPAAVRPSLTIDLAGTYRAELVVSDGQLSSAPDLIEIKTTNSPPVADAGPDQTVFVNTVVTLDAGGSTDVDGDFLVYQWQLIDAPAGSAAILSDVNALMPTLTIDLPERYVAELRVNDGMADSDPDTVMIDTLNSAPVADAGSDQTVKLGDMVQLDGSASGDVDNDPLTFQWSLTDLPPGSTAMLSDPSAVDPVFVVDRPGTYTASLVVNDGSADSAADIVLVATQNSQPVASAGPDIAAVVGDTVVLDGSASSDADNDPLTFNWSLLSGPSVPPLSGAATDTASFVAPAEGAYVAQLIVNDGSLDSDPDTSTVQVSVNTNLDTDGDGLTDVVEATLGTDPNNPDTDGDGLTDGDEVNTVMTDPLNADSDGDTLSDGEEVNTYGTLPNNVDTDGDGTDDGIEVSAGTNPLDAGSRLPPDPAAVASALDRTVATDLLSSTDFLISGPDPVQTGVDANTLRDEGRSVVRGRLLDDTGNPLPGIRVGVRGQPELGTTLSRADGVFDMLVNGGKQLSLVFERDGFLPATRTVEAAWDEFRTLPDIVMLELDSAVTTVQSDAATMQVARGTTVADGSGQRTATLLIPAGTSAVLEMPDGSQIPAASLEIRATEYTVGDDIAAAMPASLPPTSALTYAVELSADEAIAAGADDVVFDQPLYFYVDNFVGFDTGLDVPMGFLDRATGNWVPSEDGRVIEIVAETSGLAEIDADGDGAPEDAAALAALGLSVEEQTQLAALYAVGDTLWRVPVTHFTPWDPNYPFSPPADAVEPSNPPPSSEESEVEEDKQCSEENFSFVNLHDQTLGESVDITGTGFSLNYVSDRVPGRTGAFSTEIVMSGDTLPASLIEIVLEVDIAGRTVRDVFPAVENLRTTFVWDGLDAYGRPVQGEQVASIRIGYVYPAVYQEPADSEQSFGQASGVPLPGVEARQDAIIWQEQSAVLGVFDARAVGLGGWTFDAHHFYDPAALTLHFGNGDTGRAQTLSRVIDTVTDRSSPFPPEVIGAAGEAYFVDDFQHVLVRVEADGTQTVIAGNGTPGFGGDGGPAADALLNEPTDVTVDRAGNIYIADSANARIRRIAPDGTIDTVAGGGAAADGLGDDGPGVDAILQLPGSIELAPDGTLYIADEDGGRVRRLSTNGIVNTVAGTGVPGFSGDGGPASAAQIGVVYDLALGPDGTLYLADGPAHRIRAVSVDGTIRTIAGTGTPGFSGDGGQAASAELNGPEAVAVSADGIVYVADTGNAVLRQIDSTGIIQTIAGTGTPGTAGDGGPAALAELQVPVGVGVGPDGGIFVTDGISDELRRIGPPLPGFANGEIVIPSSNALETYIFDRQGRHLRTLRTDNGATLYGFEYDASGLLTAIDDAFGNRTQIERQPDGTPLAIVSPFGQRTNLQLLPSGYLQALTDPGGEEYFFGYNGGGLLTSALDPGTNQSQYGFDAAGRLISTVAPSGATETFSRIELTRGHRVTRISAEGQILEYEVSQQPDGSTEVVNRFPGGLASRTVLGIDGTETVQLANGQTSITTFAPDPRFGMQAPVAASRQQSTPGGIVNEILATRTVQLADPADPFSATEIVDTESFNGATFVRSRDPVSGIETETSPAGRPLVAATNAAGQLASVRVDALAPLRYRYDSRGRLLEIAQGSGAAERLTLFDYQPDGPAVTRQTDPSSNSIDFADFTAGNRPQTVTLPTGDVTTIEYDVDSRITALSPPERGAHRFEYTPFDALSAYVPPQVGSESGRQEFSYNGDKQIDEIRLANGDTIDYVYDPTTRQLVQKLAPGANVSLSYFPQGSAAPGELATLDYSSETQLAYGYDGELRVSAEWSGDFAGRYDRAFNNQFRIASDSVNSANAITYAYGPDVLLSRAGAMNYLREQPAGGATAALVSSTTLDSLQTDYDYNEFGELIAATNVFDPGGAATDLYTVSVLRDLNGRVSSRTETVQGTITVSRFTYNPSGRLIEVSENGVPVRTYEYDANGNRLLFDAGGAPESIYDAQDRLTRYEQTSYVYDGDGMLVSATTGTDVTTYDYDAYGNLRSVSLPDGSDISYIVDGENRRVGRRVDGSATNGWVYLDNRRIAAELDGGGQVVSRFVYGNQPNTPDYMLRGGERFQIIADFVGSPRLVVNSATGAVVQRIDYDEFGQVILDTNPGFQPFGFAGGLYDAATGLTRFGARDYDARTGRFTARDPLLFTNLDGNLYAYAGSDPVNSVDIDGRESQVVEIVGRDGSVARITVENPSANTPSSIKCKSSLSNCVNDFLDEQRRRRANSEAESCPVPWETGNQKFDAGKAKQETRARDFIGKIWDKLVETVNPDRFSPPSDDGFTAVGGVRG